MPQLSAAALSPVEHVQMARMELHAAVEAGATFSAATVMVDAVQLQHQRHLPLNRHRRLQRRSISGQ